MIPSPRRALASAAAVVLLALPACSGEQPQAGSEPTAGQTSRPPSSTPSSPAAEPSASPGAEPTESPGADPVATSARAVYYLADTATGPRLYREFVARPDTGDVLADAVSTMLTRPPDDDDYTSLWPPDTRVLSARVEGSTAFVDLSAQTREANVGTEFAELTVQQLVHTVTAAEPSAQTVQVLVEGEAPDSLWGSVDLSSPVARSPQIDVLAPVWLLTPVQGGSLARGEQFGGVATVFEATVSWRWTQAGDTVAEGFSTATEGAPGRGEWSAVVEVPPGDYVLETFESSAQDGSARFVDSKNVTVTG